MVNDAEYCQSLAAGLIRSLEKRFAGVFYNFARNIAAPDENVGKTLPFGDLLYPVSSAMDPEFRLDWLLDEELKCRVSGNSMAACCISLHICVYSTYQYYCTNYR